MGVKEIRTAVKIDWSKPAWEQPYLHVRNCLPEDKIYAAIANRSS